MDTDHNIAALLFPTFAQASGQTFHFHASHDPDLALLCVQVYNDWMIEEWCDAAPGRFIGNMLIPMWDPLAAAEEIKRTAARGARAFSFPGLPGEWGLPPVNEDEGYWDPPLAAAEETGLVVCTHLSMNQSLVGIRTLQAWLASTKFQRFHGLKLALCEGGIGWIPAAIGALEWGNRWRPRLGTKAPARPKESVVTQGPTSTGFISALPSTEWIDIPDETVPYTQLFRDHVYGSYIYDEFGVSVLGHIGFDNVMIETDFPHTASEWPHSLEVASEALSNVSATDRSKILRDNACRVYNFEPAFPSRGGQGQTK
jgi:predicted TIM-barrel fold metal-dependent hydrolase